MSINNSSSKISFKELPSELSSLFIKRSAIDIFICLIIIGCCLFFRSKELWIIALIIIILLNVLNFYFFWQLCNGRFYILEAVCKNITISKIKLFNSETKVELLLQNHDFYYTLNISKQAAKNITEDMALRVYVSTNNAYKKSDKQIVIINPILIVPIWGK